jgi:hypothetical protein
MKPSNQIGHNSKRDLADIAADIHALERNAFDYGTLLIEAREACERGDWLDWLSEEFAWSADTADNYMKAARLAAKYRTVRNLKVPMRIIYDLDIEDPDLPAIIEALDNASKATGKTLSVYDAEEVIRFIDLRKQFGNYPDATLDALARVVRWSEPNWGKRPLYEWAADAVEELKKVKPDTKKAVDEILLAFQRRDVEALFGAPLPDWLDFDGLGDLKLRCDEIAPEHRQQVLAEVERGDRTTR